MPRVAGGHAAHAAHDAHDGDPHLAPGAPHHDAPAGDLASHAHSAPARTSTAANVQGIAASVRYGPFELPPASSDEVRERHALLSNVVLTNLPKPCQNCFITTMEPNLVYEDGREANYDTGAMLHHNVLAESWYEDKTCRRQSNGGGIGLVGRRFFASGNERTGAAFPKDYGIFIDNSTWTGLFEIMNHLETPQSVYLQLNVRYVPATEKQMKAVTPLWLDVDNCDDSQVPVAAGRTVTNWDWTSTVTGRVVLAAGHVHDGGVAIELANATTNASMCRSVAGYGNRPSYEGAIDTMTVCSWDRIGVVRRGETLRISAPYDTAEPVPGAMGIVMAFVYETDQLDGGTPAPREMTHPPDGGTPPPSGHTH